jgi:hypothetical protein
VGRDTPTGQRSQCWRSHRRPAARSGPAAPDPHGSRTTGSRTPTVHDHPAAGPTVARAHLILTHSTVKLLWTRRSSRVRPGHEIERDALLLCEIQYSMQVGVLADRSKVRRQRVAMEMPECSDDISLQAILKLTKPSPFIGLLGRSHVQVQYLLVGPELDTGWRRRDVMGRSGFAIVRHRKPFR